jgi:hypothetical protein
MMRDVKNKTKKLRDIFNHKYSKVEIKIGLET